MKIQNHIKNFFKNNTSFWVVIRFCRSISYSHTRGLVYNLFLVKIFDILHGTDFSGLECFCEIDDNKERSYAYEPSSKRIIEYFKRFDINSQDAIVDLGCGKGYVMYLISQLNPKLCSGVELNSQIAGIARNNLSKVMPEQQEWHVYVDDAGRWEKYDDYNVFYMYNPFPEIVVREVNENICNSIRKKPRTCLVFYWLPIFPEIFAFDNRWRLLEKGAEEEFRGGMWIFQNV